MRGGVIDRDCFLYRAVTHHIQDRCESLLLDRIKRDIGPHERRLDKITGPWQHVTTMDDFGAGAFDLHKGLLSYVRPRARR